MMISVGKRNPAHPPSFLHGLLLLVLICEVFGVDQGDVCTNPEGVQGICVEVRSCTSLLGALRVKPLSLDTKEFLRKSLCGFRDRNPLVCCPPGVRIPDTISSMGMGATEDEVSQHPNLRLLRRDKCGPDYQHIIGPDVQLMELPWLALLVHNASSGSPFKCEGSVINERYVLTAAHCVTGLQTNLSLISVRLGEHNLNSSVDCENDGSGYVLCAPPPQDIQVEEVIPHPRYDGISSLQYDIALIRLSSPANFTYESVQPICLPIERAQREQDLVGKLVQVAGWVDSMGRSPSPKLLKWNLRVMSHLQCTEALMGLVSVSADSQICAGVRRTTGYSCSDDSGKPLVYSENIQGFRGYVQYGVSSFGPRDCWSSDLFGVYVRVGHFMKWILDTIEP